MPVHQNQGRAQNIKKNKNRERREETTKVKRETGVWCVASASIRVRMTSGRTQEGGGREGLQYRYVLLRSILIKHIIMDVDTPKC
jgi:hypothetical protein